MCANIFLSYCETDKPRLQSLVDELSNSHHRTLVAWRDTKPGDDFVSWISHSLVEASHMVVAWSHNAAASAHVRNEYHAFYALHPDAGPLLFLRIDDTELNEPLFLPRQWLRWTNESPPEIAIRITEWLVQSKANMPLRPADDVPIARLIRQLPNIRVPFHKVKPLLIEEYAEMASDYVRAMAVLGTAISIISAADPQATYVRPIYLPGRDAPILSIWHGIFDEACKHGARMVAALLYALPDDHFAAGARIARLELLNNLHL